MQILRDDEKIKDLTKEIYNNGVWPFGFSTVKKILNNF